MRGEQTEQAASLDDAGLETSILATGILPKPGQGSRDGRPTLQFLRWRKGLVAGLGDRTSVRVRRVSVADHDVMNAGITATGIATQQPSRVTNGGRPDHPPYQPRQSLYPVEVLTTRAPRFLRPWRQVPRAFMAIVDD